MMSVYTPLVSQIPGVCPRLANKQQGLRGRFDVALPRALMLTRPQTQNQHSFVLTSFLLTLALISMLVVDGFRLLRFLSQWIANRRQKARFASPRVK